MNFIDITAPISANMPVWPGDPPVKIKSLATIPPEVCNLSEISMSLHTGTHMDAPLHYDEQGKSLDQMPLKAVIGRAKVIEVRNVAMITELDLATLSFQVGDRVLFKTSNSDKEWWRYPFNQDYVHLSPGAARLLVAAGVFTIGVDYLSVGGMGAEGVETHQILLAGGIWLIEGLNLTQVPAGEYELLCLPMKVLNSDGAPARAVLSPLNKKG